MGGTVQKVTEARTLDQAVLLTTGSPLGLPPNSDHAGSLTRVGGLSLFQRAVLTLQRGGISQAVVLVGEDEDVLRRSLREDPRVTLAVRWMPTREFPPDDPHTWEVLAGEMKGACLVVGVQAVFSPELIERLRQETRGGQATIVLRGDDEDPAQDRREVRPPATETRNGRSGQNDEAFAVASMEGMYADLLVVSPSLLGGASGTRGRTPRSERAGTLEADPHRGTPLRGLIAQAAADGRVAAVPVSSRWYQEVRGPAEAGLAERALLDARGGELEGFVDRFFNRKLSATLTRLFVRIGLSPNTITALSLLIGLLAAGVLALGSYGAGILGALLFQLSAIVDCCDGEVARLTFTESKFGERLDLLADNIVHMAIFAGLAWGDFRQQATMSGWVWISWLPLVLGGAAILANAVSLWLVWRTKDIRDRHRARNAGQAVRLDFVLQRLVSRDFSVILFGFALLGLLDWFLLLAAIGANAFWMAMVWVIRSSTTPRV